MNCFQHIPESCGALHNPCGGAPQQRGPLTPQTQTRPNRLHNHTHPPKRLAHPRSPIPPLSTLTSRATHAHPTSLRSTGFCAIWDCISSSSQENGDGPGRGSWALIQRQHSDSRGCVGCGMWDERKCAVAGNRKRYRWALLRLHG